MLLDDMKQQNQKIWYLSHLTALSHYLQLNNNNYYAYYVSGIVLWAVLSDNSPNNSEVHTTIHNNSNSDTFFLNQAEYRVCNTGPFLEGCKPGQRMWATKRTSCIQACWILFKKNFKIQL